MVADVIDVRVIRRDGVFAIEEPCPTAEVLLPDRCQQLGDFWWPNVLAWLCPLMDRTEGASYQDSASRIVNRT